jgi:hypothetical protein
LGHQRAPLTTTQNNSAKYRSIGLGHRPLPRTETSLILKLSKLRKRKRQHRKYNEKTEEEANTLEELHDLDMSLLTGEAQRHLQEET